MDGLSVLNSIKANHKALNRYIHTQDRTDYLGIFKEKRLRIQFQI